MDIQWQEDLGFFQSIAELWQNIYPAIQIMADVGGAIGFIQIIKNIFKKKIPTPHSFSEFIYKQNEWNHTILASYLNIDAEQAKNLLKGFGYEWDNSRKLYTITEEKKNDMINKINSISVFGIEN